ncbi:MAG: hypothetical protein J4G00_07965 [Actinomycetia bacterium]|nr:hypothetical protein [Actinomycetes bacterium]
MTEETPKERKARLEAELRAVESELASSEKATRYSAKDIRVVTVFSMVGICIYGLLGVLGALVFLAAPLDTPFDIGEGAINWIERILALIVLGHTFRRFLPALMAYYWTKENQELPTWFAN